METIFILAVSLLPCLVYLSMCIYLISRFVREEDGGSRAALQIQRDYVIFLTVLAVCFLSGCLDLWFGGTPDLSMLTDRTLLKVYLVSSVLPCILLRRYGACDRPWIQFYVPAFLISALMILAEILYYVGDIRPSFGIMCRSAVAANLFVFMYILFYSVRTLYGERDTERIALAKELLLHLVFMAVYNILLLHYSFGIHFAFDYFLTVTGFSIVHTTVAASVSKGRPMTYSMTVCGTAENAGGNSGLEGLWAEEDGREPRDGSVGSPMPLKERLLEYFESEKPYLSKNLTMEEVAMRLFTNKSYLSKTINVEMNKNFRELVNYYRVKEAINIFSSNTEISMNELRDRCGFNNNASFTSAFKLNTGYTPGEWCRDMKGRRYKAMNKQEQ